MISSKLVRECFVEGKGSFKKCIKQKFLHSRVMTIVANNSPMVKFFTLCCFYNVFNVVIVIIQLICKTCIQHKVM